MRYASRFGLAALVAMLVLWRFAQRTDGFWYNGGLAAYAVLTSLVVLAAVRPDGVVRRTLGFRPLMALGIISYGAYLIHWPVFVFVDHPRRPASASGRCSSSGSRSRSCLRSLPST